MRPGSIRKGLGVLVSLAALAAVILLTTLTIQRMDLRPRTDDAYLQADLSTWRRT
jgi:multidrug resistance efflux pump